MQKSNIGPALSGWLVWVVLPIAMWAVVAVIVGAMRGCL